MTTAPIAADPLDDMVANPVAPRAQESIFFGQVVVIDRSDWRLERGRGRVPFDATYDAPEDRVRGITIQIECEKRGGDKFIIDTGRNPLLEIDKAWHQHTLKSLQQLGVPLSTLRTKFVQVKRVDTGETYTDKNGESKPRTALVFVAVYEDWHAMHAAREELFGSRRADRVSMPEPAQAAAPAAVPTIDKTALEKLLPALWQASGKNRDVFTTMFQGNPALTGAFTLDEAIDLASLPF
jgi:hypothetical protein